jgi:hypothetical protein
MRAKPPRGVPSGRNLAVRAALQSRARRAPGFWTGGRLSDPLSDLR